MVKPCMLNREGNCKDCMDLRRVARWNCDLLVYICQHLNLFNRSISVVFEVARGVGSFVNQTLDAKHNPSDAKQRVQDVVAYMASVCLSISCVAYILDFPVCETCCDTFQTTNWKCFNEIGPNPWVPKTFADANKFVLNHSFPCGLFTARCRLCILVN